MKKECVVYCESDYITNLLDEGMVKVTCLLSRQDSKSVEQTVVGNY